jgi:hypothetical protein
MCECVCEREREIVSERDSACERERERERPLSKEFLEHVHATDYLEYRKPRFTSVVDSNYCTNSMLGRQM